MMLCRELKDGMQNWIRDYDRVQRLAVILIYIQIGCGMIGSLGALYNGVLLMNLGIALFALVAIESSSQSLGRTYAFLLFFSLLLDISWFFLFSHHIWTISSDKYGTFFTFSVYLTLAMQIVGSSVRFLSSLLWIQIYRLGVSCAETRQADYDLPNSFLSPLTPAAVPTECSDSDLVLGGSVYDPAYFSSLFEDRRNDNYLSVDQNSKIIDNSSTSSAEASQLKLSIRNN